MRLQFFKTNPKGIIPSYAHEGDSGMDISATDSWTIPPHEFRKIGTGIGAVIPKGHEIQVRPRSGMSAKHGVVCSFGTVDEQYRGEIGVTLYNHGDQAYLVKCGDRVAQLVLVPVIRAEIEEVDRAVVGETDRGTNGFGSTGR